MLDDLKLLHERDTHDNLGNAGHQAEQLAYVFDMAHSWSASDIYNVVIVADSYSALAGLLAKAWLVAGLPVEVVSSRQLPAYIGERTLCIVLDNAALTVNSRMVVHVEVGRRLWQGLKSLALVFDRCGLTEGRATELAEQQQWLADHLASWLPQKATSHNRAKQIALELIGRSVVVYGGDRFAVAAQKWQIDINTSAKQLAWLGDDRAFGNAGFVAWTKQPVHKLYAVVELRTAEESDESHDNQLFAASDRLLSGLKPVPIIVEVQGETILRRLLYASALSDYVSSYLAILNGVSPAESPIIAKLNKELS